MFLVWMVEYLYKNVQWTQQIIFQVIHTDLAWGKITETCWFHISLLLGQFMLKQALEWLMCHLLNPAEGSVWLSNDKTMTVQLVSLLRLDCII